MEQRSPVQDSLHTRVRGNSLLFSEKKNRGIIHLIHYRAQLLHYVRLDIYPPFVVIACTSLVLKPNFFSLNGG